MLSKFTALFIPSKNDRLLKELGRDVERINGYEAELQSLDDAAFPGKTQAFKQRHEAGESLDDLLPEAFALVREASRRVLGERHYDVQLVGGISLHTGRIAEMKTGEGFGAESCFVAASMSMRVRAVSPGPTTKSVSQGLSTASPQLFRFACSEDFHWTWTGFMG